MGGEGKDFQMGAAKGRVDGGPKKRWVKVPGGKN